MGCTVQPESGKKIMKQIRFAPSVYMDNMGDPWVFDDFGSLVQVGYESLTVAVNSEFEDLDSAMKHEKGN